MDWQVVDEPNHGNVRIGVYFMDWMGRYYRVTVVGLLLVGIPLSVTVGGRKIPVSLWWELQLGERNSQLPEWMRRIPGRV